MAKKTTGAIYTSGKKEFYYLRYKQDGKDHRIRLLDPEGKPIHKGNAAQAEEAAARILAPINETNKAEQWRTVKNNIQDAEAAAEVAQIELVNSRALIANGWPLFMSCPKRPVSCRKHPADAVPRHSTAGNYRGYYVRFVDWMNSNYSNVRLLSEVTAEAAAAFMDDVRSGSSSGTFNKYLQFFNCFFDTLQKARKITGNNPFTEIERERHRYNSKKPLSREKVAELIEKAEGELKLLLAEGYYFGLRCGDCCTLDWSEIDMKRGVIERLTRKVKDRVKDIDQAIVKLGIPPEMYALLDAVPEENRTGFVTPGLAAGYLDGKDEEIFERIQAHFSACGVSVHRAGTGAKYVIDPKTGKRKNVGSRAVVEYGFHSLRYSYISHHAEEGTPAAIIQRNAGQANPAMTRHYTKISDAAAVKYARALQLSKQSEPERDELRRLADSLPIETIQRILKSVIR